LNWLEEKDRLGKEMILDLYALGAIKTWYKNKPEGWTLFSGLWSPFYIQLRPITSYKNSRALLQNIAYAIKRIIEEEAPNINKLLGVAYAGIPIAIACTMVTGIPSCYTRKIEGVKHPNDLEKEISKHGERSLIEGELKDGDTIAIVDDIVTELSSKLLSISELEFEIRRRNISISYDLNDIIVLIDREQGAKEKADDLNLNLHALIPFRTKGIQWLKEDMTNMEYEIIDQYLKNPRIFQNRSTQLKLIRIASKFLKR